MPRKPRFVLPGVPQHIVQRGNNRSPCFFAIDDYFHYLRDLREAAERNTIARHAYVLMTNYVHLLCTPETPHGISHMMQDIGRKYVRYINKTYRRTGTLWEGRCKASLVDTDGYLLACMRHIELNPVRANMVAHPGEYQWSSYHHNAAGKDDPLLKWHPLYQKLGVTCEHRQFCYRELFNVDLDREVVHDIRQALSQELVLGRSDFKEMIEKAVVRQVRPGVPGRPRVKERSERYHMP